MPPLAGVGVASSVPNAVPKAVPNHGPVVVVRCPGADGAKSEPYAGSDRMGLRAAWGGSYSDRDSKMTERIQARVTSLILVSSGSKKLQRAAEWSRGAVSMGEPKPNFGKSNLGSVRLTGNFAPLRVGFPELRNRSVPPEPGRTATPALPPGGGRPLTSPFTSSFAARRSRSRLARSA